MYKVQPWKNEAIGIGDVALVGGGVDSRWVSRLFFHRLVCQEEVMQIDRYIRALWPWRWWCCLRALGDRVRLHPSIYLYGNVNQIKLGYGTVIGARGRLHAGISGRIVTGERVWVSSDVEIETDTEVRIGDGTTIQRRCTINGSTRIGVGCIFAPNVFVSSGTHPFRAIAHLPIREQERRLAGSKIGFEFIRSTYLDSRRLLAGHQCGCLSRCDDWQR